MQALLKEFSRYRSFRRVHAAEVTAIYSASCVGVGPDKVSVSFDPSGKPTPEVGWWCIRYEDGYLSFCPPAQFKAGYARDPVPTRETIAFERELTEHRVNPANDQIDLLVLDGPGAGGACHEYVAVLPNGRRFAISFQNGPIAEAGVNGVTQEALLAIVADRLRSFQAGPYACRENALALTKIEEAAHWLASRTRARMARGVEGTHKL